jgi:O-antigen ligase
LILILNLYFIYREKWKLFKSFKILTVVLLVTMAIAWVNVEQNRSWQNFFSDFKIAIRVDQHSTWYDGTGLLPVNEDGENVSGTNYDRISWGVIGLRLITENPLGYGLVDRSFRYLTQKILPESSLAQSHSGWIDFTLGVGVPGALLVILTFLLGLKACRNIPEPYKTIIWSVVISTMMLFITTEVSQNIYIAGLFLIMGATIGFGIDKKRSDFYSI